MPGRHTAKQKRQAKHVADSERKRGVDPKRAESIGWATVNKQKVAKGPGFIKPIGDRIASKKPVGLDIGKVTVTDAPKPKPVGLDIGKVTVTNAPKPVGLDIGKVTVTNAPKPSTAPSTPKPPQVATKSEDAASGEAYAAMGKGLTFNGPKDPKHAWIGKRADTFHGHYNVTPLDNGEHRASYSPNKSEARKRYGSSKGLHHADLGTHSTHESAAAAAQQHHKTVHQKLLGKVDKAEPLTAEEQFRAMTEKLRRRARRKGSRMKNRQTFGKALQVMSLDDYHSALMKATPGAPAAPGAPAPGAPKKFPRKEKPTVKMKPISDAEAMTNLRAGKHYEKSMLMLAAIKALVTGYGKVSGGGALRAANRGAMTIADLNRAMEVMPKPSGAVPPATTYLPGVHGPEVKARAAKIRAKASKRQTAKSHRPITSSKKSPRALDGGGATILSSMTANEEPTLKKPPTVVHKSEGAATMSKTNFNDLFKSELGIAADDVLVDCPHCEEPITKSDLAKAHKGKGAVTNVSGPKHGKSSAHVVDQNPEGGTMRGGEGRGVLTSSRGVPGAQKTDAVTGVQNSKGSARKSDADSSSDDASSMDKGDGPIAGGMQTTPKTSDAGSQGRVSMRGVAQAQAQAAPKAPAAPKPTQVASKGMSVRGTDFVQYVDYGDAPGGDAYIAKSIAEAQGALGQQATQPMDLNNDLSRLLV